LQGYGDYATPEQGLPVGRPADKYWELCMTINDSWGYQQNDKEFKSPDTLSEINFFLGIIHMKKGFQNNNSKSFKLAVKYLNAVDPGTRYFNDALWYRALTELKLGNRTKGKSILETLLKNKYLRSGEVQKLRDMVGNAM